MDGLLSLKEAATRKGVPTAAVQEAIETGELPAIARGGAYYIDPDELDVWSPHAHSATGADIDLDDAQDYLIAA